jgi:hypothetical protein
VVDWERLGSTSLSLAFVCVQSDSDTLPVTDGLATSSSDTTCTSSITAAPLKVPVIPSHWQSHAYCQ